MSNDKGMDDNTLLVTIGVGFVVVVSAIVLAAAPIAGLVTGRGWVSSTKSLPETVLLTITRGPGSVYEPAPPTWAFCLVVGLFAVLLIVAVVLLLRTFGGKKPSAAPSGAG